MTPLQMKYFDAVCRFQNISKAAASLHISQPTITISIQALESELGIKLSIEKANTCCLPRRAP